MKHRLWLILVSLIFAGSIVGCGSARAVPAASDGDQSCDCHEPSQDAYCVNRCVVGRWDNSRPMPSAERCRELTESSPTGDAEDAQDRFVCANRASQAREKDIARVYDQEFCRNLTKDPSIDASAKARIQCARAAAQKVDEQRQKP